MSIPESSGRTYAGKRVERVVGLVDVMPTILSLAGVPEPGYLHGRNLLTRLESSGEDRPLVYSQYPKGRDFALRRGDWKLIGRFARSGDEAVARSWELYDLRTDPGEQVDLLADGPGAHAEVFETLRAELERIIEAARRQGEALEAGEAIELDAETRRQLEALGYL